MVHQRIGAHQRARHRAADVDQVLAGRLEPEHLVERGRAVHLGGRDLDEFGDVAHRVLGDVAVLLLAQVHERDQRRLLLRVPGDDLAGHHHVVVGDATHRSTPPRTGSTRRDDGDSVGDEAAAHHVGQALDVHEGGVTHVHPVRLGRTVAGDVAADLAARALDADVDLALGHLEALGEDLEVVDQRLHRLVDARPRWRGDLLVLDAIVARRHQLEDLGDDAHRLADLGEPDRVAVEAVAVRTDDHVEVELVVVQVRHVAAEIPLDAGRTQDRAGRAERHRLARGDHPDALQPLTPDRLAGHQDVVLVEAREGAGRGCAARRRAIRPAGRRRGLRVG